MVTQPSGQGTHGFPHGLQRVSGHFAEENHDQVFPVLPLVQALAALNPKQMVSHQQSGRKKFWNLMTIISSAHCIPVGDCDAVISQYDTFLDSVPTVGSEEFPCFDKRNTRIDEFLMTRMEGDSYHKLCSVLMMVLVLSHGQTSVEGGFSVNKRFEAEKSMVSQRLLCEYVNECGGIAHVPVSIELLPSASAAHQRYHFFLDEQRATRKTEEESRKRKAALDDLELQKQKHQCLGEDIASLNASAENCQRRCK